jgi:hypothetical protein
MLCHLNAQYVVEKDNLNHSEFVQIAKGLSDLNVGNQDFNKYLKKIRSIPIVGTG